MKIESCTVCVGYSDILAVTLPLNLELLDRMIVVTSYDDEETYDLCSKYDNVFCVRTDRFHDNAEFAKSRGLNQALRCVSKDCWVIYLDADILLPLSIRDEIEDLDGVGRVCMHSCMRRFNVFKDSMDVSFADGAECPGFFQVLHSSLLNKELCQNLPEFSTDAAYDDLIFSRMIPGPIIMDINVCHLDEERQNWSGRKTPKNTISIDMAENLRSRLL